MRDLRACRMCFNSFIRQDGGTTRALCVLDVQQRGSGSLAVVEEFVVRQEHKDCAQAKETVTQTIGDKNYVNENL